MGEEKNRDPGTPESSGISRREALESLLASAIAAWILPGAASAREEERISELALPELPPPREGEDVLITMMRDLQRALKKPVQERKWVMVIDTRKCVGCHACTVGCVVENKLPPGVVYRPVLEEEMGEYPHVARRFIPRPCMQCENPPCTPVCPVNATYKRPDGVVAIDYDRCIGCRYCITACPYNARTFDFGEYYSDPPQPYETIPSFEYHRPRVRGAHTSPVGNARKCHFCLHRVERGYLPKCVTTCIGRATYFGDRNDPDALVNRLIARPNVMRLKEELGTEPKVYYLI